MQFGIVNDPSGFVGFLEALKQEDMLKVLAEPNLVTVSGRPASYLVGGQVPYPQPTGFGNISIDFQQRSARRSTSCPSCWATAACGWKCVRRSANSIRR